MDPMAFFKVVVDDRLPPNHIFITQGPYRMVGVIRWADDRDGETTMATSENGTRIGSWVFPDPKVEAARRDPSNLARGGNGRLQSMTHAELIEEIQRLQRRARTHKKTITQLNAAHNEDLRLIRDLHEDNNRLAAQRDEAVDKLKAVDDALYGGDR